MENPTLKTSFKSTSSDRSISFLTDAGYSFIVINRPGETGTSIRLDAKDSVSIALAVLGVGRVTDKVEKRARVLTDYTEEQLIEFAVTNLRAAMLIREQNSTEQKQLVEDAFALYKLAYPHTSRTEFHRDVFKDYWITKLKILREDKPEL